MSKDRPAVRLRDNHARTVDAPTRMDADPGADRRRSIGDLIRQMPGTISLGQGVVHYGPPPAAVDAVRDALAAPGDARVPRRRRAAGAASSAIAQKLAAENGIDVARGSRVMVTAGANMAFMHAVLAITAPGDEVILPVPFYFNHEMAIEMAGCRVVRVPTDERYQLRSRRDRARDHAAHARDRHHLAEQPERRGAIRRRRCARSTRCAASAASITSRDEPYEYFTYGARAPRVAGLVRRRRRRTRSRCTRCRRRTGSPAGASATWCIRSSSPSAMIEESRTRSSSARRLRRRSAAVAALEVGRAYCEPHVRELAVDPRHRRRGAVGARRRWRRVPAADGAFYCLLRVNTDARSDGARPNG